MRSLLVWAWLLPLTASANEAVGATVILSSTSMTYANVTMIFPPSSPRADSDKVRYGNVFPGIDLVVYRAAAVPEYDWIVAPGADPRAISVSFSGACDIHLDNLGDLVLGSVHHLKPFIYQSYDNRRLEVQGGFELRPDGVGFRIGTYDPARPLVIDPQIVYQSGFGGSGEEYLVGVVGTNEDYPVGAEDTGTAIAADRFGNVYVVGTARSTNFPGAVSPYQSSNNGGPVSTFIQALFYAKIGPDGGAILYSGYIGVGPSVVPGFLGPPPGLFPAGIAVDSDGNVYITGTTDGTNFPQVGGSKAATAGGPHAFVLKLDPNGVLLGALLFGGGGYDAGTSITIGPDGYLYVTGVTKSSDFPVTAGAALTRFSGGEDAFVMKLNPALVTGNTPPAGAVVYSTFVAPAATVGGLAVDPSGSAYVATGSTIAKLSSAGDKFVYSVTPAVDKSALAGVAVDSSGTAYVTTDTGVSRISPDGSAVINQTLPIGDGELAMDPFGNLIVSVSGTPNLPPLPAPTLVNAFQSSGAPFGCRTGWGIDNYPLYGTCYAAGYLISMKSDLTTWNWSSYLGTAAPSSIATDANGNLYAVGAGVAFDARVIGQSPTGSVNVVKITPAGNPLQFDWHSITDAAAFQQGLPGSGGLASIIVTGFNLPNNVSATSFPLPTELAGVSISGCPLLSITGVPTGGWQIIFQAACDAAPLDVQYNGLSNVAWPQVSLGPVIFVGLDGTPVVQHASDGSFVTGANPAVPGENIVVWATGLDASLTTALAPGTPASGPDPVQSLQKYSCSSGTVLYAGPAPGFVGVDQVNVTLSPQPSSTMYISSPQGMSNKVLLPIR
jgi:uncharacterized protein (TIGR03437 family)